MTKLQRETTTSTPTITTTSEERTWAALAHASTLLTLLVGLPTAGLSGMLLVFIPFLIYLTYRDKSKFVARQAAQAFTLQIVASTGYFVALIAGIVVVGVAWVITVILSFILIGLILIPVSMLIMVIVFFALVAFPFAFGTIAIIAAIETTNSRDYRYPYIGVWVEAWLDEHEAAPAAAG